MLGLTQVERVGNDHIGRGKNVCIVPREGAIEDILDIFLIVVWGGTQVEQVAHPEVIVGVEAAAGDLNTNKVWWEGGATEQVIQLEGDWTKHAELYTRH